MMKTIKSYFRNTRVDDIREDAVDSFYEEISRDWQQRARDLQERRWRKLGQLDDLV